MLHKALMSSSHRFLLGRPRLPRRAKKKKKKALPPAPGHPRCDAQFPPGAERYVVRRPVPAPGRARGSRSVPDDFQTNNIPHPRCTASNREHGRVHRRERPSATSCFGGGVASSGESRGPAAWAGSRSCGGCPRGRRKRLPADHRRRSRTATAGAMRFLRQFRRAHIDEPPSDEAPAETRLCKLA